MTIPKRYRRRLPHILPDDSMVFLTCRLWGSIPNNVYSNLRQKQAALRDRLVTQKGIDPLLVETELRGRYFLDCDHYLDQCRHGAHWLKDPRIADIVAEALHHRHPHQYFFCCYTIMSNHVHLVVRTRGEHSLADVVARMKSYTAKMANKVLQRQGPFWQAETFDHVVRAHREDKVIRYVLDNPVKAGLVSQWDDWPYTWLNPDF